MTRIAKSSPASKAIHLALIYGESVMSTLHLWILLGGIIPSLPLPATERILGQHWMMTYAYLMSDMALPLFIMLGVSERRLSSPMIAILSAHTASYLSFMWEIDSLVRNHFTLNDCCSRRSVSAGRYADNATSSVCCHILFSQAPVMEWAYSDWNERAQLQKEGIVHMLPALAVIIDLISHSWGLYVAYISQCISLHSGISAFSKEKDGGKAYIEENMKRLAAALGIAVASASMKLLSR